MKLLLFVFSIFLSLTTWAQQPAEPQTTVPVEVTPPVNDTPTLAPTPVQEAVQEARSTRMFRGLSQVTTNIHWSPISTWLPMKYGLSLGYIYDDHWTFEGEWTQKSYSAGFHAIDFGDVTDRRFGIQSRWYPNTNSFNFIMGFFKSEFSAKLGNTAISHFSTIPSSTIFKLESFGPELGVSNRWQWSPGVTLGVDWFIMYIPLFKRTPDEGVLKESQNTSDRSDLDKITSLVQNIPQFDLLRITLGYTF